MIQLNNSSILPSRALKPRVGFDADLYRLMIRNNEFRESCEITYTINTNEYKTTGISDYTLPEIDKEYTLTYTIKPTGNLREYTASTKIFQNHINCRDYHYEGDFYSTHIIGYNGILKDVVIPDKHNLIYTTSADIDSFPNITSDEITVTTPVNMYDFMIKDDRITEFTVKGNITPREYQFANLPNLTNINGSFNACSDYMFYNCPKLNMDPSNTRGMSSLGKYAFFNTPEQHIVRVAASTISNDVFNYDTSYGSENLKKAIFTSADTINGYNRTSLYGKTNQVLSYTNPDDNTTMYHEVFCGLIESAWEDEEPTVDKITIDGSPTFSNNVYTIKFKSEDPRVIGMQIKVTSSSGTEKGSMVWLPKNITSGSTKDYFKRYSSYKEFYLSQTHLYNETTSSSTSGSTTTITIGGSPNINDIFTVQPITRSGLSNNTYTLSWGGDVGPTPDEPIYKVLYTGGVSGSYTATIDDGAYSRKLYSSASVYNMWMTFDADNPSITFRLYNPTEESYINGSDGNLSQFVDFSDSKYISVSGKKVYILNLADYYATSNLLAKYKLRCYYTGYMGEDSYYDLPLTKKLTGTTN